MDRSITIEKFEELVRDSEKLAVVTEYVKNSKFVRKEDLVLILGIQEDFIEKKECETDGN